MDSKYILSKYVMYVKKDEKLLLFNCKNGAILLIDDKKFKVYKKIQENKFELEVQNEYDELLKYGFIISSNKDEVEETKQTYLLNKTKSFFSKDICSITFKLYEKSNYITKKNLYDFMELVVGNVKDYRYKFFKLKLILNKKNDYDELKKMLSDLINKLCNYNVNFKLDMHFDDCFSTDLVDFSLPYLQSLTVNINKNDKKLLDEVLEDSNMKKLNGKINIKYDLTQDNFEGKELQKICCGNIDDIIIGTDNIGDQTIKEIMDLESEVVKKEGIKKLQWLRPGGMVCEYSFQQTAFIDYNLKIYRCTNTKTKEYSRSNLKKCFSDKEDKTYEECFSCKFFYMCLGKNCILKEEKNFCPIKVHFIEDYLIQLLDNLISNY